MTTKDDANAQRVIIDNVYTHVHHEESWSRFAILGVARAPRERFIKWRRLCRVTLWLFLPRFQSGSGCADRHPYTHCMSYWTIGCITRTRLGSLYLVPMYVLRMDVLAVFDLLGDYFRSSKVTHTRTESGYSGASLGYD